MSQYPSNPPYDETSDDDGVALESSQSDTLKYRRAATLVQSHPSELPLSMGSSFSSRYPAVDNGMAGDQPKVSLWEEACAEPSKFAPEPSYRGPGSCTAVNYTPYPPGPDDRLIDSPFEPDPYPGFFSPFGDSFGHVGKTTAEESSCDEEDSDTPCVITLPSAFRLERTNFVVTAATAASIGGLSVVFLLQALRSALAAAGVDVLDFKPAHCVLECSYHMANRFISLFIRVFRAPDRASGQLLDSGNNDQYGEDEEVPFLVEAQLREGDRLHFSELFREIMRAFTNEQGVHLAGTFRYKPRPYHRGIGEGLALEPVNMAPPRGSARLVRGESRGGGGAAWPRGGPGGFGPAPPPVPADMAKTQVPTELDTGMLEDVMLMANMLQANLLDVQAEAATVVAGLTSRAQFLAQLCMDGASAAANELAGAAVRLLAETRHKPARRQAAVVVANLSAHAKLHQPLLLATDKVQADTMSRITMSRAAPIAYHQRQHGRLVDVLVELSFGIKGGVGNHKEEEIGTRRECMRALVGLAECQDVKESAAMKLVLSNEPTGRGANDAVLKERLLQCRAVLKNHC